MTAVELMPVSTFPGNRGWGYDGVLNFAPHVAYGGPEGLARFVEAAHAAGLAVILDVVYNHIGPGSEILAAFGPYFTCRARDVVGRCDRLLATAGRANGRSRTPSSGCATTGSTGCGSMPPMRSSTRASRTCSRELADRVSAVHPGALVIAEAAIGDRRPLEEWGHDALWDDDFHHALHVL